MLTKFYIKLVVKEQVETIKITLIFENKSFYSIISFYNLSLFTTVSCRFSGIYIEKTTFEEFVEICEQIHRK